MSTTKILRHINARRCLRLVHSGRNLSRANIARELGLTRATIGNAILVLLDAGLVVERSEAVVEARKGRPGVAVALNPSGACFIGVDIGTRSLTGVVLDLQMNVVIRLVEPTGPNFRDPEYVFERLLATTERLVKDAAIDREKIEGICVSIPGLVARDGSVVNAPFLEWRNYPFREKMVASYPPDWTVTVCNDAFAFASAERVVSEGNKTENLLLVLLAEGIGGAIIDDGRVIAGAHGYSGEIGHTIVTARGRTDTFEMLAGSKSFSAFFKPDQAIAEGVAMLLAQAGKPEVADALDFWAEALSAGLANAIHLLDPGRIVLGGPLSALYPHVAEQVRGRLQAGLLPGFELPQVLVTRFGADGAAIGAAATIRETMFAMPDLDASDAGHPT